MEFISNMPRILLKIYQKDETNSTIESENDNFEFVQIVKIIMDENEDLNGCELNYFIEKINILLNEYIETLKIYLTDSHGQNIYDEFYNIYSLSQTFKFKEFFNKYNLDDKHRPIVGKIFSINSVINYIKNYINDKDNSFVVIFVMN
jgi:hypothetical protein